MENNEIERLIIYKKSIQSLYDEGFCKGIISRKKIKLLVAILSDKIKQEEKVYTRGENK